MAIRICTGCGWTSDDEAPHENENCCKVKNYLSVQMFIDLYFRQKESYDYAIQRLSTIRENDIVKRKPRKRVA